MRTVTPLFLLALALGVPGAACKFQPEGVVVEFADGTPIEHPFEVVDMINERDEFLQGVLVRPKDPPASPLSAVVLLHGSGGLYSTPDSNDTHLEVTAQYAEWADLLADRGHAVLLPSSFYSRGYFEWDERPRPRTDEVERNVMRTYDAYAALAYLCYDPDIDCERVASLGFSNGGSVTLMAQYEGLDDVAGMGSLPPPSERGHFVLATAYYPGCHLHDQIPGTYFPLAPLHINHGTEDPLLEHCPGRVEQAEQLAAERGLAQSPLTMKVYSGAEHSFDEDPRNGAERSAQEDARAHTAERYDALLRP